MLSYHEFRKQVESGKNTCEKLTRETLDRIEQTKDLNAFITVTTELALQSAKESDKRFAEGNPRALEGMIISVKDNISTEGIKTTCASQILENYTPIYDATVVERLKNAGAIIIGKTNLDEFAMGSSNENSFFGLVKSPVGDEYVPGGSSGGSAVAVAADLSHVSLGSETGGSVRQPASFTGIFGYKPSYGAISRYGLTAFGSSLDQIGIFSRSSEDIALALDVMSGEDSKDATSMRKPAFESYKNINQKSENLVVGVLSEEELKYANFDVLKVYQDAKIQLEKNGFKLKEVSFPQSHLWIPIYYIIATAEASSNLARYDGVRYGKANPSEEGELITSTRSSGFGDEVKRRILLGTYVLSAGHHDQYFIKALKARRKIKENIEKIFEEVDTIFLPTTPTPAFKFGDKAKNPVAMYMADIYTASANLAGVPAINIPVGKTPKGLPIGLQLQNKRFDDERMIAFSKQIYDLITQN